MAPTRLPSDKQLNELIAARIEHSKVCPGQTPFTITLNKITMSCPVCEWHIEIEDDQTVEE